MAKKLSDSKKNKPSDVAGVAPKGAAPEAVSEQARKKRLLWFGVGISAAVIVTGWLFVLPLSLRSQVDDSAAVPVGEVSSGWNRFLDRVSAGFRNVTAILKDESNDADSGGAANSNAATGGNSNTNSGLSPEEAARIKQIEDETFSEVYK